MLRLRRSSPLVGPHSLGLRLGLVLVWLFACQQTDLPPSPDAGPPPVFRLSLSTESVAIHPGESRDVTITLRDDGGRAAPGQVLQFTIVDDPETAENDAQGATLSFGRSVTNAAGQVVLQIIAGLRTRFNVTVGVVGVPDASTVLLVFVEAGTHGQVAVSPVLPTADRAGATWAGTRVSFFDGIRCNQLVPGALPATLRPPRLVTPGVSAHFDAVTTASVHAAYGVGLDDVGVVRFSGCVDVPGVTLLENVTVHLPLPLAAVRPQFYDLYRAVSQIQFVPPPAGATQVAATWGQLSGCPYDPAQLWLDCTIDAVGEPAGAVSDCRPEGGEGALGAKLLARRGAADSPMGTRCRALADAMGRPGHDSLVTGLFPAPSSPLLAALPPIAREAAHLTDLVKLRSLLSVTPTAADAQPRYVVEHVVDVIEFSMGMNFASVKTLDYAAPARSARVNAVLRGGDLVIDSHGFGLRLGTAARSALVSRSLAPRTGFDDVPGFVDAVFTLATASGGSGASGCAALDALLCADVGEPAGCLMAACTAGLSSLAVRLSTAFDALDGTGLDLVLGGLAPLVDREGDGNVDALGRLAPEPARPGLWTGELRARGGTVPFSSIWISTRVP